MGTGPFYRPGDETFLDAVRKEIAQSANLSSWLLGNQNRSVPSLDKGATPVVEAAGFFGEISVEVAHEGGKLVGILRTDEKVVVVGEADEAVDTKGISLLGSSQYPYKDCSPSGGRLE